MSRFKLEFKLKQHTPLIHFQGEQYGATLKGTELKSKIERFILNELSAVDNDLYLEYREIIENDDIFPEEKGSSQYSLKISQMGNKRYYDNAETKRLGAYFGGYGSVMYDEDIIINIFSFSTILAELIQRVLPYVVIYNNFGTRNNKGFGSYSPKDITIDEYTAILRRKYTSVFQFSSTNPLKDIKDKYMTLKGGVNFRGRNGVKRYEKSHLFEFFCSRGIRWEKRQMKETLQREFPEIFSEFAYDTRDADSNRIVNCRDRREPLNYRFIRALLGLAEEYTFRTFGDNEDYVVTVRDTLDHIKRFKSPITFKVFNNMVFLLPEEIPNDMFDREFTFDLKQKRANGRPRMVNGGNAFMTIRTPERVDNENIVLEFLRTQNFEEVTP